jgi:hypothetical protein
MSSEKFYINTFRGWFEVPKFSKVKIAISGFEHFDIAIHRVPNSNPYPGEKVGGGYWTISEGVTGMAIGLMSHRLQSDAIDEIYKRLATSTPEKFQEMIDLGVKERGVSPRWEGRYQAGQ